MEEEETMDRVEAEEASTSGNGVEKAEEEPGIRLAKRAKVSGESERAADLDANMKRVAEIVIVLAGMGRMRGGRSPMDVERELMAEARRKLACMCESLPPRELLSKDAYGVLVEDLGLNRLNDQKGLGRPRLSIAEKLRLTMKKIEEAKEFAAKSSSSQTPHNGLLTNINGQSMTNTNLKVTADKLNSMAPSLTGFQPFTPVNQTRPVSASASHNHVQANEPLVTSSSHLETDSSQQVKTEIRYGGMSHSAQSLRATSAGDQVLGSFPGSSSVQFSSVSRDKISQGLKQTIYGSRMDQGIHKDVTSLATSQLPDVKDSRVLHQASGGPYSIHHTVQHASSLGIARASHTDIVRDIQKLLQPGSHSHPVWSPPSLAYMDAPLTCQICKVTITDVGSLLVCDACEKGVHVRCLHAYNQKSIPQGEWNCPKCLISNHGKPLPLKYGRIGKLVDVPKLSNANSPQSSMENKIETSDKKSNQQKLAADGCAIEPNKDMLVNHVLTVKGSIPEDITGHGTIPSTGISNHQVASGAVEIGEGQPTHTDGIKIDLHPFSTSETEKQGDNIHQTEAGKPIMNYEKIPKKIPTSEHPQPLEQSDTSGLVFKPSNQARTGEVSHESLCVKASANPLLENGNIVAAGLDGSSTSPNSCKHDSCGVVSQADQNIPQPISGTIQNEKKAVDCEFPEERFPSVSWVGNQVQVVDGKSYYQACFINEVEYKLQDHAFFHSEDPSGAPYVAKLEALWEDNINGTKWARVSMCYSCSNLPQSVGQPCTPEENEVYESNHQNDVLMHLIRGPCSVMSESRYRQEKESGVRLGSETSKSLSPLLFCRWFYDDTKGLFQPFTDR
ncbi:PHD finger protein [Nymphaea thermarum]|nr:PHD finger protein [Nymphaea thermarum]